MEIVSLIHKKDYEEIFDQNKSYFAKPFLHFSTWNQWNQIRKNKKLEPDDLLIVIDDTNTNLDIRYEKAENGIEYPHVYSPLKKKDIIRTALPEESKRTGVLMNTSMIDVKWCFPILKPYIHKNDKVCVLAMSYFNDTQNVSQWNQQYSSVNGCWYKAYTDVFFKFGLKRNQIEWVNPFTDDFVTIQNKILKSSILFLPGGAPDLLMKRIKEKRLQKYVKNYQGLVIGVSAGAMVQLKDYHITPDEDYSSFGWYIGLGYFDFFDVECHYKATSFQKEHIHLAISQKHKPVYALYEEGGLIVNNDKEIKCFGKVDLFEE